MKEFIFWALYIISVVIIIYRINKALIYFNAKFKRGNTDYLLSEVSVIQIITENRKDLRKNLENNIRKMAASNFLFVVTKDNNEIKEEMRIIIEENNNCRLIEIDENLSFGEKLGVALEKSKNYVLILDEYIELEGDISEIIGELSMNKFIVNGLIYSAKEGNILVGLNSAFHNSHRIFTDLSLAEKGMLNRLNRKFFAAKKDIFLESRIIEYFKEEYINEVEIVKEASEKGITVFQSRVIGRDNYEASDSTKFSDSIGDELDGFRNIRRESLSPLVYILTVIPVFLPSLTLFYSANLGGGYIALVVVSLFLKAIDTYFIRKGMVDRTLWYGEVFREFFIDVFGIIFVFYKKSR